GPGPGGRPRPAALISLSPRRSIAYGRNVDTTTGGDGMTSTQVPKAGVVTDGMRRQYEPEGYFILGPALRADQLELLRGGAQVSIDKADAEMDEAGVDRLGINARGKRYFSPMIYQDRPELRRFLFSDLMAGICQATLGVNAYL